MRRIIDRWANPCIGSVARIGVPDMLHFGSSSILVFVLVGALALSSPGPAWAGRSDGSELWVETYAGSGQSRAALYGDAVSPDGSTVYVTGTVRPDGDTDAV